MKSQGTEMFEALGVSDVEERVYRALLNAAMGTTAVARATNLSRGQVEKAIAHLEAKALLVRTADKASKFSASPPDSALRALLHRRRLELEEADAAISALVEDLYSSSGTPVDLVELIRGEEAVAQRGFQLMAGAKEEVMSLSKPPYAVSPQLIGDTESNNLKRGVKYRMIYSYGGLDVPGHLELIESDIKAGESARVLPDLPMKLIMADRQLALMTLNLDEPDLASALAVRRSSLLDALIVLFEALWEKATPFGAADRDGQEGNRALPEFDQRLITLLSSGLKDEAVARHLGITSRTLRRHVVRLLGDIEARNRFQLGAEAAWRGWIHPR